MSINQIDNRRKGKENVSRSDRIRYILGGEYRNVVDFYKKMINKAMSNEKSEKDFFFVFVTRRSNVLFSIFFDLLWNEEFDIPCDKRAAHDCVIQHFITDKALINNAAAIADIYCSSGVMPEICIVDELLIHGRALNKVLMNFEDALCRYIYIYTGNQDDMKIGRDLYASLTIWVYARNRGGTLLYPAYLQNLIYEQYYEPVIWRELSQKFSLLVNLMEHNNTAYSLSIVMDEEAALSLNSKLSEHFLPAGFRYFETWDYEYKLTSYMYAYPSEEHPLIVFNYREKFICVSQDEKGTGLEFKYLMVPYVVHGNISMSSSAEFHKYIVSVVPSKSKPLFECNRDYLHDKMGDENNNDVVDADFIYDSNDLYMSFIIMYKFFREKGLSLAEHIPSGCLDKEILARNYFRLLPDKGVPADINGALDALWAWNPDEDIIRDSLSKYTVNMMPIWNSDGSEDDAETGKDLEQHIIRVLEGCIYELGLQSEKDAFRKMNGSKKIPVTAKEQWGSTRKSLADIVNECHDRLLRKGMNVGRLKILSYAVHEMDEGSIGMYSLEGNDDVSDISGCTMIKAGEQSLFIRPSDYRNFIPVLVEIDNDSRRLNIDKEVLLDAFLGEIIESDSEKRRIVRSGMMSFYKELEESGQSPDDWNFDLSRRIHGYKNGRKGEKPFYNAQDGSDNNYRVQRMLLMKYLDMS